MKTITRNQYLQVVGLLTVAANQYTRLTETERALVELLGQEWNSPGDSGHCCDAIYSGYTADELLGKLGIEVQREETQVD